VQKQKSRTENPRGYSESHQLRLYKSDSFDFIARFCYHPIFLRSPAGYFSSKHSSWYHCFALWYWSKRVSRNLYLTSYIKYSGWRSFYSLSNLLIQITDIDRYLILLLSIVSIVITIVFLRKVKRETEGHLAGTRTLLVIFIVIQSISLILNITGRFSLAKIVGVTAVFNLWNAGNTLFYHPDHYNKAFFIQFHVKKAENTFITWIDI